VGRLGTPERGRGRVAGEWPRIRPTNVSPWSASSRRRRWRYWAGPGVTGGAIAYCQVVSLDLVRIDDSARQFCRWEAVDNGVRKSRNAVENVWEVEMSPVVTVTRSELEDRRRALLDELGLSLEEFEALADTRTLTGHEFDVKEELDEIAFLLGE
jgi:hypothetical protein